MMRIFMSTRRTMKKIAVSIPICISVFLVCAYYVLDTEQKGNNVLLDYENNSNHLEEDTTSPPPLNEVADKGLTFYCSSGQLGNRMFFYAVVYGLARLNNRQGFIQKCNTNTCGFNEDCPKTPLDKIFNLSLPIRPNLLESEQRSHNIDFHLRLLTDSAIPKDVNILTGQPYPVSVTYFLHVRDEIRREFRFQDEIQKAANEVLQQAKGTRDSITFISVHVRRGSYLPHLKVFNKMAATPEFFQFGLGYYRLKYKDAVFIVLSDDLPWCRTHIQGPDVVVPADMGRPEQDLAVMSSCQHSLFDYGTYGFWGAFLAGGEAMYFVDGIVDPVMKKPTLGKVMYPPDWIGVSNDMLISMRINNSCKTT